MDGKRAFINISEKGLRLIKESQKIAGEAPLKAKIERQTDASFWVNDGISTQADSEKSVKNEIEANSLNSIRSIEAAQQSANNLSFDILTSSKEDLLSSAAGNIDFLAVLGILRG